MSGKTTQNESTKTKKGLKQCTTEDIELTMHEKVLKDIFKCDKIVKNEDNLNGHNIWGHDKTQSIIKEDKNYCIRKDH